MKYLFILSIVLLSSHVDMKAQDIIVKPSGDEIEAKVLEITDQTIKYKLFNHLDGPTRSIEQSDVFLVIYENGTRESFEPIDRTSEEITQPFAEEISANGPAMEETEAEDKTFNHTEPYFAVSLGWGQTYGGFGTKTQFVSGGKVGVGFHFGLGYFPGGSTTLINGGLLVRFKNSFYLDLNYGQFGVYERTDFGSFYESGKLAGIAVMGGYNTFFNKTLGINLAAGVRIDTNYNVGDSNVVYDVGFIIKI